MDQLPHGLKRVAHAAHKSGAYRDRWEGSVTFVTNQPMLDEIAVQRDLEALVLSQSLNLFGIYPMLASVSFDWSPTPEQKSRHGERISCLITVGYHSGITYVTGEEIVERLTGMSNAG